MLTPHEIQRVVAELASTVEGAIVERFSHPTSDHYILHLAHPGSGGAALRLVVHPRWPRLSLTRLEKKRPSDVPGELLEHLRRDLVGRALTSIRARAGDRLVVIRFEGTDAPPFELRAELFPPSPNLVLTDASGRIRSLHRSQSGKRALEAGEPYVSPPLPTGGPEPESRYGALPEGESWNRWVDQEGRRHEEADERETLTRRATQRLTQQIRKLDRKHDKLAQEVDATEEAGQIRQRGELLLANLHRLKRGQAEVTVEDYYTGAGDVTIELDPTTTPQQNVERLFKRARKLETGRDRIRAHLAETEQQLTRLREQLSTLEGELDLDPLRELAGESSGTRRKRVKRDEPDEAQPRKFVSRDGLPILVGRNDRQNHELTIRRARGNDLWLHVDQAPGSHVLVPLPKGQQPPPETLLDAAQLALYYSKVRGAKRQTIVYTRRKFIRHPKGAPPGRVTISQEKRLEIGTDADRLRRLVGKDRFDA